MILRMKIHQVMSIGNNMIRLILVRPSLKARIEPLQKSDEQRIAEDLSKKLQQTFESMLPSGGIVIGSPTSSGQWDAKIDMTITDEEYNELGKPSINDMIEIDIRKELMFSF